MSVDLPSRALCPACQRSIRLNDGVLAEHPVKAITSLAGESARTCAGSGKSPFSDFVRRPDGTLDLTRLRDGRIMCCLCFQYLCLTQFSDEGVCKDCARRELAATRPKDE